MTILCKVLTPTPILKCAHKVSVFFNICVLLQIKNTTQFLDFLDSEVVGNKEIESLLFWLRR